MSEVREESKDAVVVSLAIAHAIQKWLEYIPGSRKQKTMGLEFTLQLMREGGPTWDIPVSDIMTFANGFPSLTPYMRGTACYTERSDLRSQFPDIGHKDETVA